MSTQQDQQTARAGLRNAIVYNPANPFPDGHPKLPMLSFLRLLQKRYQNALRAVGDRDPRIKASYPSLLQSLTLAEASLVRESLGLLGEAEPLQIGVFGPTQSGKSSVINWISGLEIAKPSPLAGFTVHPQGFSAPRSPGWLDRLGQYFEGYRRMPSNSLTPDDLEAFGYDTIESSRLRPELGNAILWDTPDFDSVAAHRYEGSVLRLVALMDLVVIVVSKDKYGDLSVWEFIRLIEPLAQPTLLIINKTESASEAALIDSVSRKWTSFRKDPLPGIVTLPYSREEANHGDQGSMTARINSQLEPLLRQRRLCSGLADRVIDRHWTAWTQPIHTENGLSREWSERLEQLAEECLARYQRDYLEHPNHYETFQRALAELLTLLEVPGIGTALHAARRVVTWPMRQLTRLGRAAGGQDQNSDGIERGVLHQIAQHALIQLSEELLLDDSEEYSIRRWRGGLSQQLSAQRATMLGQFDVACANYVNGFRPEIESTARSLYAHLEDHPVILNSLRATRVTTDAAALGVALHTGGIGIQDFVIAPAILSMTSLLAESTLGHFMTRSQEQLKRKQLEAVESLFRHALMTPLTQLPSSIDPGLRIGVSTEQLERVESHRLGS